MPDAVRIDPGALGPAPATSLVPVTDGTVLPAPASTSALVIVDRNPTGSRVVVVPPAR
jgi:hypothetical protein